MISSPLILSIATATSVCTTALHQDGELLAAQTDPDTYAHSRHLPGMIAATLQIASRSLADLHAIAVPSGPGSYTGLRIGIATAKAVAYACRLPLIAIDTLQTLPLPYYQQQEGLWCVLLDARHGRTYTCIMDMQGTILKPTHTCVANAATFAPWTTEGPLYFVGSGAEAYDDQLLTLPHSALVRGYHPHAAAMGSAARQAWKEKRFVDLATFSPSYMSAFTTSQQGKLPTCK